MVSEFIKIPARRGTNVIGPILNILEKTGGVCAGGYARYCASPLDDPAPASDIDIFTGNQETFVKVSLAFDVLGFTKVTETTLSVVFRDQFEHSLPIQVIKPLNVAGINTTGSSSEDIIRTFDFSVTRVCFKDAQTLLADREFLAHETDRKLIVRAISDPLGVLSRIVKYIVKGYSIPQSELIKVLENYANLSPEDRAKYNLARMDADTYAKLKQESKDSFTALDLDLVESFPKNSSHYRIYL